MSGCDNACHAYKEDFFICSQNYISYYNIFTSIVQQLMAALLVLLLLLAVPLTAFCNKTTDVYYVTAHDAAGQQSCPPYQICHSLSYYMSQPDYYFTSDTTIIFLEGEHMFDQEYSLDIRNVHDLTLKGQGQSTVIIWFY